MLGKTIAVALVIFILAILVSLGKLFEYNALDSILVIQSVTGKVTVYTTPGYKPQNWGSAMHYKKSAFLSFNPKDGALPIKVRFAEGGHGDVAGSCRYDMPLDTKHIMDIQQTFGSPEALEKQLIRTTVEKSMYMTGPLMTSTESFSVRRPDLINLFEDQAKFGVFQTTQVTKKIEDPLTGQEKWITASDLKKDKDGSVLRQEESPLIRFGIPLYNIAIVDIDYEKIVQDQIAQQQSASTAVQIAKANSLKAAQDAITVEAQGRAAAAKSKWDQEVIKAQAVTLAEQEKSVATTNASQRLEVASLDKQAAEQKKQEQILLGEGESQRRKLLLAADNALQLRGDIYLKASQMWANALANFKGNLVPQVVQGGGNGAAIGNSATALIDLLNVKVAKDLALDMQFQTAKQP